MIREKRPQHGSATPIPRLRKLLESDCRRIPPILFPMAGWAEARDARHAPPPAPPSPPSQKGSRVSHHGRHAPAGEGFSRWVNRAAAARPMSSGEIAAKMPARFHGANLAMRIGMQLRRTGWEQFRGRWYAPQTVRDASGAPGHPSSPRGRQAHPAPRAAAGAGQKWKALPVAPRGLS
jgi:hypothetical protein